jgi:NodT family efflux transporter outer membrane factor (OMF) lipoprotein
LNRLIEAAKQDNLPLRMAGLRILESRALLGIAGSSLYPQVQQASGAFSYVNTRQRGGDLPDVSQSLVGYQLGFNMAWELDFWGRFKRGVESADAAFFASIANQQDVQVLISAQVADLYFAYRTTEARIVIARENAAIQKRSFEITERIFNSGGDSELDLQQAKTQYLATLSTIPQLELTLIKTRNALSVLLGRAPGDFPELAGAGYKLPAIDSAGIQAIPARLLTRRPDIRAAAWQVAAQSAQIGIAEADYYPAISLLGAIGWSGSSLSGSPTVGNLAVGPAVRWNIFDYGRIENNVRVQDARLQQLIEQYQETVLQAAREIDDAAIGVVKTAEQQTILDQSVSAARRALEIANTRYREGYSDFQRVLDAQRSLFAQAERQLINHGNHISSVIGLYKGLGGGWERTPVEQLIPEEVRRTMQERSDWGNLLTAPIPDSRTNPPPAPGASQHE